MITTGWLNRQNLFWLGLYLYSASVFAVNGHVYIGGGFGQNWAEVSNSNPQIDYADNILTDAYPLQSNHASSAILFINGGYVFAAKGLLPAVALGVGFYDNLNDYPYS